MAEKVTNLHVLVVDDAFEDREILKRYLKKLEKFNCEFSEAKNVEEALQAIRLNPPDLMFVDFNMPGATGLELLDKIGRKRSFEFPVIMLTGEGNENVAVSAMKSGVVDYLIKDKIGPDSIRVAVIGAMDRFTMEKTIEAQRRQLEVAARTDGLTGLWNRRYFDEQLEMELERAQRYGLMLSLAMADLDHFKDVNDNYGHLVGDSVLMGFGDTLKQGLRLSDFAARFGGEEFCMIMPNIDTYDASLAVCRLAATVRNRPFRNDKGGDFSITASFGIVMTTGRHTSTQSIIDDADKALYTAKEQGRDRVVVCNEDGSFTTVCAKGVRVDDLKNLLRKS